MDVIQSECEHPERCVIGHPFNPPHNVPLVEVVGGAKTSEATIERATLFYASTRKNRCDSERPCRVTRPTACRLRCTRRCSIWFSREYSASRTRISRCPTYRGSM